MKQLTTADIRAGMGPVRAAPSDGGVLRLIVARPAVDEREVLTEATLDAEAGLVGDGWRDRLPPSQASNERARDRQLTLMNARFAALVARDVARWPLAGDQLYIDLDIGHDNLPAGTRLAVGDAVIEITEPPHTGCAKFAARFGDDALAMVNSPEGKALRLRGVYARVVRPGTVRTGDGIRKLAETDRG